MTDNPVVVYVSAHWPGAAGRPHTHLTVRPGPDGVFHATTNRDRDTIAVGVTVGECIDNALARIIAQTQGA